MQVLACPVCKGKLKLSGEEEKGARIISGTLYCPQCDKEYPIIAGLPHLLPPELEENAFVQDKMDMRLI